MITRKTLGAILASAALITSAAAQEKADPPPEEQSEKQPDKTTEKQPETSADKQPQKDPLTGLDTLLGLKDETETPIDAIPLDPAQKELDTKLSGAEISDAFVHATQLMDDTASRIEMAGDTGLVTQRLQEDILRTLDQIIEAANQQQQQSQSKSSSSSSSQKPSPQQSQSNQAGEGENKGQVDPPARQSGALNAAGAGEGATWGALPARVRDALSQGQSGRFSSLYRSLTEAYYRRLAEEAGK